MKSRILHICVMALTGTSFLNVTASNPTLEDLNKVVNGTAGSDQPGLVGQVEELAGIVGAAKDGDTDHYVADTTKGLAKQVVDMAGDIATISGIIGARQDTFTGRVLPTPSDSGITAQLTNHEDRISGLEDELPRAVDKLQTQLNALDSLNTEQIAEDYSTLKSNNHQAQVLLAQLRAGEVSAQRALKRSIDEVQRQSQNDLRILDDRHRATKAELDELSRKHNAMYGDMLVTKDNIAELKATDSSLDARINAIETEKRKTNKEVLEMTGRFDNIKASVEDMRKQVGRKAEKSALTALDIKVNTKANITDINELEHRTEGLLLMKADKKFVAHLEAEVDRQVERINDKLVDLTSKINDTSGAKMQEMLNTTVANLQKDTDEAKTLAIKHEADIHHIEESIKHANITHATRSDLDRLEKQLNSDISTKAKESDLAHLKAQTTIIMDKSITSDKAIQKLDEKMREVDNDVAALRVSKASADDFSSLLGSFKVTRDDVGTLQEKVAEAEGVYKNLFDLYSTMESQWKKMWDMLEKVSARIDLHIAGKDGTKLGEAEAKIEQLTKEIEGYKRQLDGVEVKNIISGSLFDNSTPEYLMKMLQDQVVDVSDFVTYADLLNGADCSNDEIAKKYLTEGDEFKNLVALFKDSTAISNAKPSNTSFYGWKQSLQNAAAYANGHYKTSADALMALATVATKVNARGGFSSEGIEADVVDFMQKAVKELSRLLAFEEEHAQIDDGKDSDNIFVGNSSAYLIKALTGDYAVSDVSDFLGYVHNLASIDELNDTRADLYIFGDSAYHVIKPKTELEKLAESFSKTVDAAADFEALLTETLQASDVYENNHYKTWQDAFDALAAISKNVNRDGCFQVHSGDDSSLPVVTAMRAAALDLENLLNKAEDANTIEALRSEAFFNNIPGKDMQEALENYVSDTSDFYTYLRELQFLQNSTDGASAAYLGGTDSHNFRNLRDLFNDDVSGENLSNAEISTWRHKIYEDYTRSPAVYAHYETSDEAIRALATVATHYDKLLDLTQPYASKKLVNFMKAIAEDVETTVANEITAENDFSTYFAAQFGVQSENFYEHIAEVLNRPLDDGIDPTLLTGLQYNLSVSTIGLVLEDPTKFASWKALGEAQYNGSPSVTFSDVLKVMAGYVDAIIEGSITDLNTNMLEATLVLKHLAAEIVSKYNGLQGVTKILTSEIETLNMEQATFDFDAFFATNHNVLNNSGRFYNNIAQLFNTTAVSTEQLTALAANLDNIDSTGLAPENPQELSEWISISPENEIRAFKIMKELIGKILYTLNNPDTPNINFRDGIDNIPVADYLKFLAATIVAAYNSGSNAKGAVLVDEAAVLADGAAQVLAINGFNRKFITPPPENTENPYYYGDNVSVVGPSFYANLAAALADGTISDALEENIRNIAPSSLPGSNSSWAELIDAIEIDTSATPPIDAPMAINTALKVLKALKSNAVSDSVLIKGVVAKIISLYNEADPGATDNVPVAGVQEALDNLKASAEKMKADRDAAEATEEASALAMAIGVFNSSFGSLGAIYNNVVEALNNGSSAALKTKLSGAADIIAASEGTSWAETVRGITDTDTALKVLKGLMSETNPNRALVKGAAAKLISYYNEAAAEGNKIKDPTVLASIDSALDGVTTEVGKVEAARAKVANIETFNGAFASAAVSGTNFYQNLEAAITNGTVSSDLSGNIVSVVATEALGANSSWAEVIYGVSSIEDAVKALKGVSGATIDDANAKAVLIKGIAAKIIKLYNAGKSENQQVDSIPSIAQTVENAINAVNSVAAANILARIEHGNETMASAINGFNDSNGRTIGEGENFYLNLRKLNSLESVYNEGLSDLKTNFTYARKIADINRIDGLGNMSVSSTFDNWQTALDSAVISGLSLENVLVVMSYLVNHMDSVDPHIAADPIDISESATGAATLLKALANQLVETYNSANPDKTVPVLSDNN